MTDQAAQIKRVCEALARRWCRHYLRLLRSPNNRMGNDAACGESTRS